MNAKNVPPPRNAGQAADLATGLLARANGLVASGKVADAIKLYQSALRHAPKAAVIHYNLANALAALGASGDAMAAYRRALSLQPGFPAVHANLSNLLWQRGDRAAAIAHLEQAVALDPRFAVLRVNLGKMLCMVGRVADGIASLKAAVDLAPNDAAACFALGNALLTEGVGGAGAIAAYFRRAIELDPSHAAAHVGLGQVQEKFRAIDGALPYFDQAIRLDPQLAWAHAARGGVLAELGRLDEARASFRRAIELQPDDPTLRVRATMAELPGFYGEEAEVEGCRIRYAAALEELERYFAASRCHPRDAASSIGAAEPFYLPYQGLNDRELQARHGALVHRVMARAYPHWATAPRVAPPAPGEPVRVAVVSRFFNYSAVWNILLKGWVANLDRRRFRLFGYHTGPRDQETERIAPLFDRFVEEPGSFERWGELIRADAPHIALFPAIGMDPLTLKLAALRMAPVQCTSWAHPETSGLPTVDFFLGSDLMEPVGGEQAYTERLVRLPKLGISYTLPTVSPAPARREAFGIKPQAVAFWCCQSTFKYLPQYDVVFPRIAERVPGAQFVFVADKSAELTQRFHGRLAAAFAAAGMAAGPHIVVLPRLDVPGYLGIAAVCDIFLDSIGWSGGNTTMESVACDLPVVTWPGAMMRGRHSLAILQVLGVAETVAASLDEYVDISVRLATDLAWRSAIRAKIAANRPRLYGDEEPIRALEAWIARAVGADSE